MRKTYHFDETTKRMVEGPAPRKTSGQSGDGWMFSDRYLDGTQSVDGVDISTKRKRREYMKRHNLAPFDEAQGDVARARRAVEDRISGRTGKLERVAALRDAYEQARNNARAQARYG
jgi:hypothetical protein